MSRKVLLAVLLTLATALSAFAADTDAKDATVTLSLRDTSKFTLGPVGKGGTYTTTAKNGKFEVQVDLNFHVATLPRGYAPTTKTPVHTFRYGSDDLLDPIKCATAEGKISEWLEVTTQPTPKDDRASPGTQPTPKDDRASPGTQPTPKDDRASPKTQPIPEALRVPTNRYPFALLDQDNNRSIALSAVQYGKVLNNYGARFSPVPGVTWDRLKPTAHVNIWEVKSHEGTPVRMAEAFVTWRLRIPLDLKNLPKSDLLTVTIQDAGQPTKQTTEQPEVAQKDQTEAKTKEQAVETTVLAAFSGALGLPAASMKPGPGYDVVAGFAAGDSGPNAFAGIVASFEKENDNLPWWSLGRLGILGGRTGGTPTQWLIAPSFKIGGRAHFFVGEGFSASDGNDRDGLVVGLAYSVLDAVARLTGNGQQEPASTVQTVRVRIDKGATAARLWEPRSTTMPVVYLYPEEGAEKSIGGHLKLYYKTDQQGGLMAGSLLGRPVHLETGGYQVVAFEDGNQLCGAKLPDGTSLVLTVNGVKVDPPLTLSMGQVYYAEISSERRKVPPTGPRTPARQPTPALAPTGLQWWLRGQADPPPGQTVSIIITATSEKKVGSGTLQSRYSVPAQVDADGFFAVLLPQLDEGQAYRIEISREGSDKQFVIDGVTPEKGKNLPIILPELREPSQK